MDSNATCTRPERGYRIGGFLQVKKKKTIKCKRTQQFLLENVWEAKRCIMGDAQMVNTESAIAAALLTCYLGRMYFGMK